MAASRDLRSVYERYKHEINFFCVYIREAHPEDEWQVGKNLEDDVLFSQPKSIGERAEVAEACVLFLNLAMPMLLDDIENTTDAAYSAEPERLYIINTDGRVVYKSGPGPFGFDVEGWAAAIEELAI